MQSVLLKRALGLKISGYILYKKSQNQRVRAPPAPVLTHSLTPQTLSLLMSVNKRLRDPLFTMFRFSISVYIFIFVKDSRWPVVKTYHFLSCSSFFTFREITLENIPHDCIKKRWCFDALTISSQKSMHKSTS